MQKFSLHTHTSALDGANSLEEMIAQAERIGFYSLGISEYFIVYPTIKQSKMYQFAMNPKRP